MSFKIALGAGHYLYTPGKKCAKSLDKNETPEWVLNARICDKIEAKLKEYSGYTLIRLDDPTGKKAIEIDERTDRANTEKADFYLSIHHNAAFSNGKTFSGGGIVAIVHTSPSAESLDWQKKLYDAMIQKTGLKGNRATPLAKMNLHEVREPKMPAVLLECGFMDSSVDVPIILTDEYADKIATACVEVIVKKAKLTLKNGTKVTVAEGDVVKFGITDEQYKVDKIVVSNGIKIISTTKVEVFKPYIVTITGTVNIRSGAGTNNKIVGVLNKGGAYTIVAESAGTGSKKGWGKLKSGAGWIALDYCKKL